MNPGINWTVVIGAILAIALIAGGIIYISQTGRFAPPQPLPQVSKAQDETTTATDSPDTLQSDLNASGSVDNSQDLDSLDNSL